MYVCSWLVSISKMLQEGIIMEQLLISLDQIETSYIF